MFRMALVILQRLDVLGNSPVCMTRTEKLVASGGFDKQHSVGMPNCRPVGRHNRKSGLVETGQPDTRRLTRSCPYMDSLGLEGCDANLWPPYVQVYMSAYECTNATIAVNHLPYCPL